jgi:hypothetical protein
VKEVNELKVWPVEHTEMKFKIKLPNEYIIPEIIQFHLWEDQGIIGFLGKR